MESATCACHHADHFLATFAAQYDVPGLRLTNDVRRVLLDHHWPGSVRELRNAIERAVLLGGGLLLGSSGCDGVLAPEPRAEEELQFVRFPVDLAPLAETSASVWAVRGQNREMTLRYRTSAGPGSDEFMRFEIPADALVRWPDGTRFQRGDSVQITVQLGTDRRMLFHFEPSGLQFDPLQPARLRIDYRRLDGDLKGDGSVTATDQGPRRRSLHAGRRGAHLWRHGRGGMGPPGEGTAGDGRAECRRTCRVVAFICPRL